jgi:hypothetical protein
VPQSIRRQLTALGTGLVMSTEDSFERLARTCLQCLTARKQRVVSTMVATDADGLQWFECEDHEPTDNLAATTRIHREPIADWLARHGL